MRIAYVTVSMPFGPRETFLIPEATELIRQGHPLTIIPRSAKGHISNGDAEALASNAVRYPLLSFSIALKSFVVFLRCPVRCLKSFSFVFATNRLGHLLKNLCVVPKALWFADYIEEHSIEHIHCHWSLTTATMSMIASKLAGVPWSMTCHRGDIADNNLLHAKIKHASFTRFISNDGINMAKDLKAVTVNSNVYIGRMGVAMPNDITNHLGGRIVFICPANLLPVKGHQYLLKAVKILKERGLGFRLQIAGTGPLMGQLINLAHELNIQDIVVFLGQVPHHELLKQYADGNIYAVVLPSVDLGDNLREGVPVSLIEALSFGVPVISTRTGAIPELLGEIGILVKDKDPLALADAMALLLLDKEYRRHLVELGRKAVLDQYDVQKTVADLIARIKECNSSHAACF